jgi:hypothetical protein
MKDEIAPRHVPQPIGRAMSFIDVVDVDGHAAPAP